MKHFIRSFLFFSLLLTGVLTNSSATAQNCDNEIGYWTNGLTVSFLDSSFGRDFNYWEWIFGDGNSSNDSMPVHTYNTAGTYYVILIAGNNITGCLDTSYATVKVDNIQQLNCNNKIFYYISGTTVNFIDSSFGRSFNYWLWDFGDGNSASQQSNPIHAYSSTGTYLVSLISGDTSINCYDTAYATVVIGAGCTAIPFYTVNGLTVTFTDSSNAGFTNWLWDFGNNKYSTLQNPSHTYTQPGTYTVTLYAIDSVTKCADSAGFQVTVQQPTCVAKVGYSKSYLVVNFFDSSSQQFNYWNWNFGDSTTSSQQNPQHTYNQGGSYTVTLIAGDSLSNCFDTASVNIYVYTSGYCKLTGMVRFDSVTSADMARVWLIVYDSAAGMLTAIDSVDIDSSSNQGGYSFRNIPYGQFLIKVALLPSSNYYSSYLPTYYTDELLWSNANLVSVSGSRNSLDIHMVQGTNPGGPGFIGGYISQGANKKKGIGDPMPGVEVLLFTDEDVPVAYTYTDANGYFSFSNIALGTYKIHPEIYGKVTYPAIVTLTANYPSGDTVKMQVKEFTITTGIFNRAIVQPLRVYPNPAANRVRIEIPAGFMGNYELYIRDIAGKLILQQRNMGATDQILVVDVSELPSGTYLLQMIADDGAVYTQKLMKN